MQFRTVLTACALATSLAGCAQQASTATNAAPAEPPLQTRVTTGQEVGAALNNQIQVEFASGSDRLSPDANRQLDVAARLFRDVRPVAMFSVGYSDAVGSEFDNLLLAARRARAVKTGLVARGIPADQVLLRSYGQSDPINSAEPNAPANRRVLVSWRIV